MPVLSLSLSAYLKVLRLWFAEALPGDMQAIIITLDFSAFDVNESLNINVNFDALKGTWDALSSIARIHSFNPSKLNNL